MSSPTDGAPAARHGSASKASHQSWPPHQNTLLPATATTQCNCVSAQNRRRRAATDASRLACHWTSPDAVAPKRNAAAPSARQASFRAEPLRALVTDDHASIPSVRCLFSQQLLAREVDRTALSPTATGHRPRAAVQTRRGRKRGGGAGYWARLSCRGMETARDGSWQARWSHLRSDWSSTDPP